MHVYKDSTPRNYSCKPEQIILFLNFPLTDREVLASVLDVVKALLVAYVHIQKNIVGFSYSSPIMRLEICII
jgi:hypothetical protein